MRQIAELVRQQNPLTLPPHTSVQDACLCMKDRRVGAVLVTDSERLIGIFTARDAVCRVLANGKRTAETTLAEVMTREPASLRAGYTAIEALRLMQNGGFRHVPVVQDGKLLGVVSKGDFSGQEYGRLEEETILWGRIGYLKDVLEGLSNGHPMSRLDELLPWNWAPDSPVKPI